MSEPRNKQQAAVDTVVGAIKAQRRLVETARRGLNAPRDLTEDDIENLCRFVTLHADCIKPIENS